jgi:hypothetical protein
MPPPTISSIDPTKINQGLEFTLTVDGNYFNQYSLVMINADFPKTTYVSSQRLTAEVDRSVTGKPGPKEVRVHQNDGNGDLSNPKTLTVLPA